MKIYKAVYELNELQCIASEIRQDITAKNEAEAKAKAEKKAIDWTNELGYTINFVGIENQ